MQTAPTRSNCVNAATPQALQRRAVPCLCHGVAKRRQTNAYPFSSPQPRQKLRAVAGSGSFDELDVAKIPFSARQAVMQALDALGRSATAAEVASKAGLPIHDTERYLQGLASEGDGSMKVR